MAIKTPINKVAFLDREDYEREKSTVKIIWQPNAGMQERAYNSDGFEILCGGGKGSGKSHLMIGYFIRGNLDVPKDQKTPTDISYINNPDYRALMLRHTFPELEDWVQKAMSVYGQMGAKYNQQTHEIIFPTKARIALGHLDDENSFRRYFGHQIIRLAIDEVNFIKSFELYMKLYITVRSHIPEMRPQILLGANPEGPGLPWLKKRFIKIKGPNGQPVPYGTLMRFHEWNPILEKKIVRTRVYFHGTFMDNKQMKLADPLYYNRMMAITAANPALKRAYVDGDWDAFEGSYFQEYRPNGPSAGEPENARHVVKHESIEIMPWWPRYVSVDWGYKHHSSAHKHCIMPNGQLYTYAELVVTGVSAQDLGSQLAQWCLEDLRGLENHRMDIYLSPDAFGVKDAVNTIAQQIQSGIGMVLGKEASILLLDEKVEPDHFRSIEMQHNGILRVRKAYNQRVDGWQFMRTLLRFTPLGPETKSFFDLEYSRKLLMEDGVEAYSRYMRIFEQKPKDVLPRWIMSSRCVMLREAIPSAVFDPKNSEDVLKTETVEDDILDEIRYGCMAYRRMVNLEPLGTFADQRVGAALERSPNLPALNRAQIRWKAEDDYALLKQLGGVQAPFSIGRGSPSLMRVVTH